MVGCKVEAEPLTRYAGRCMTLLGRHISDPTHPHCVRTFVPQLSRCRSDPRPPRWSSPVKCSFSSPAPLSTLVSPSRLSCLDSPPPPVRPTSQLPLTGTHLVSTLSALRLPKPLRPPTDRLALELSRLTYLLGTLLLLTYGSGVGVGGWRRGDTDSAQRTAQQEVVPMI